jgi:hypothetical protein
MYRIRSACCARATIGHAAEPPSSVMKSRRNHKAPSQPLGDILARQDRLSPNNESSSAGSAGSVPIER